jgi:hypothetical protein
LGVGDDTGEPFNVEIAVPAIWVTTTVPGFVAAARVAVFAGLGVEVLFGGGVDLAFLVFVGGLSKLPLCCGSPVGPDLACTGKERALMRTSAPRNRTVDVSFDVFIYLENEPAEIQVIRVHKKTG